MKNVVKISKFMSLVLRHQPELIGLELDEQGWVAVEDLVEKAKIKGYHLDLDTLKYVVENNDKKRFAFNEDFSRIRANQGHSVEIDLGYEPTLPPEFLYHGTADKYMNAILKEGLQKRSRHHVHLSVDTETAHKVGSRHGKPIILKINAKAMSAAGHAFYVSDNGVWLAEEVPMEFIDRN
jgi:putative RNA 2'-phosphotransferase